MIRISHVCIYEYMTPFLCFSQERVTGFEQRVELCLPENIQQQLDRLLAQGRLDTDSSRQVRVLGQKAKIEASDELLQYYIALQVITHDNLTLYMALT